MNSRTVERTTVHGTRMSMRRFVGYVIS